MTAALERLRAAHASVPVVPPALAQMRASFSPAGVRHPLPPDVSVTAISAGDVGAHWFRAPGADSGRAVLYLHGGGYTLGSADSHGELIARLARASGVPVLAVDYRLAPEHPYPAAVDDALQTWRWLRREVDLDGQAMAVVGDSAGGGLALALLLALRDAGEPLPAAAAVMSPWTDLTLSGASVRDRAPDDPILTPELLDHLAQGYLAGADPRAPLASPAFGDLAGFPPLLIQVGTAEILLSDSERLAAAAAAAGVDVHLRVQPGAPHVYQSMPEIPEAIAATDQIGTFVRRRTSPDRH